MTDQKTMREPLVHIVKRDGVKVWQKILIYAAAILIAVLLTGIFCSATSEKSKGVFDVFGSLVSGVFGTERRFWIFARSMMLLLGVSLAIVPAFKMKYWNLGANGQILVGCLASYCCLFYGQEAKMPAGLIMALMIVSAILAGIIWALIPAIFKAFFKTNESLFTLMMNYLASGLVTMFITIWAPKGSGSLSPIETGTLPSLDNFKAILPIIVIAVLFVVMYFYLNRSKHGFEISIVGESENTAHYVGINYKKVVIRTLILSGAICGIVGLLLTGGINHTVSENMHGNMGFTAIMTAWLAQFNPFVMIGTCALITFVSSGMAQVRTDFGFTDDAIGNIALGIIYFFIIACAFFVEYKVIFRKGKSDGSDEGYGFGKKAKEVCGRGRDKIVGLFKKKPAENTEKEEK